MTSLDLTRAQPCRLRARTSRGIAAAALAVAVVAAVAAPASAQTTMKLASATINDVQHQWQKVFAAELEKRVGDAVTTEIYPASQLGPIPQMAEGVAFGTIEAFISPTSFLTQLDPRFKIFEVPGLFDSAQHVHRVIHDPDYRDHLETMFLDRDLRVIGAIYNSPLQALTLEPVKRVGGFDGLKIRTFASPLQQEPMRAIGASPVPMPLSEVVPQLQAGGIDGMLAGMPILVAFKYYDITPHVTDLKFAHIVSVNVVNESWFQAQSDEVRRAIREAGRAAEQEVFDWGVDNVERTNRVWRENGGKIYDLPEAEHAAMLERFRSIAADIVTDDPDVAAEYRRLKGVVAEHAR